MRSKLEENIAEELDKLGIKYTYERDKLKYVIAVSYTHLTLPTNREV